MEIGHLFPIEGGWNANATKGAVERDRTRKAEMDLMDLIQQMKIKQEENARNAEKHPLSMEELRLKNAGLGTKNQKDVLDLDLETQFGAQKRRADIGKTNADTAKTSLETTNAAVEKFFEQAAQGVAANGAMTPNQLQGLANQLGLSPDHPVVQMALSTDPKNQRTAFGNAMLQDTKTQGQLANTRLQGQNQMAVEGERTRRAENIAGMRVKGAIEAAKLRNADAKTIDHRMNQLRLQILQTQDEGAREMANAEYRELERILIMKGPTQVSQGGAQVAVQPGGGVALEQRPGATPQGFNPRAASGPNSVPTAPRKDPMQMTPEERRARIRELQGQ